MRLNFAVAAILVATSSAALAQVHVRGYTKADGTYVAPYVRTAPDKSIYNNYSTVPNVNPYTGKVGTVNPYAPSTVYSAPSVPKAPCYGYYCPN